MSSSTTSTTMGSPPRSHAKRAPVPLLLSAFPTPPTHIPTSPLPTPSPSMSPFSLHNPPPSRPPSLPLPPVPGPSPVTEQETLMFMSRRSSKLSNTSSSYSTRSSLSRRDSTASSNSGEATSVSPSPVSFGKRESSISVSSVRSFTSSTGSLSVPSLRRFPRSISPPLSSRPISEEDSEELHDADTGRLSTATDLDISDSLSAGDDGIEKVLQISQLSSSPLLPSPMKADADLDDSLASFSIADLPDDDTRRDDLDPDTEAQILHLEMRASRSKSDKHKHHLMNAANAIRARSRSASRSRSLSPRRACQYLNQRDEDVPPLPLSTPFSNGSRVDQQRSSFPSMRSRSPDIKSIIQRTPRPRRRPSSNLSVSSRSASRRRSEGLSRSTPRNSDLFCRKSEGSTISGRSCSPSELAYMKGFSIAGSVVGVDGHGDLDSFDGDNVDRLEEELEGGGSDSDSSIDLHTPLPHLMLRDGMLSPNSRLLPGMARTPSPLQPAGDRPGSIFSTTGSIMTKSGIYKDERDTAKRRTRHRDGRLLKGGLGLTTGLGWSDSEDEDAPSPLTRRLSSLSVGDVSRKSSAGSLRSNPHPLSRSVSGPSTPDDRKNTRSRSSAPPTSGQRRTISSNASHFSTGSAISNMSLTLSVAETASMTSHETLTSDNFTTSSNRRDKDADTCTPSTSSTYSLPVTPHDSDGTQVSMGKPWEKAKAKSVSLPRRIASNASLRSVTSSQRQTAVPVPKPRVRALSATSSTSSTGAYLSTSARGGLNRISDPPPSVPPLPAMPRSPSTRPLRLPQARLQSSYVLSGSQSLSKSTGPPVREISRMPSVSRLVRPSFTPPSSAGPAPIIGLKPKPRTGAGMVYRTNSSPAGNASRLRLSASAGASVSASVVSDLHSSDNVGIGIAI
ncbi:hypothetical protein NEOLEDRAFT_1142817 [Neolentinus lepideus HHB14362 ss-1]|uniref:Uncharacterized protein n=1 Tax=Neolentinus lepideus HHB14362 ss-1 TaxID=1314782 RepID=A0A165MX58_9AGAM|nr:hypothetical protein NEOLEDRAFT_1142817 [Neolentinus lepideus HHB14362 ss-1]